MSRPENFSINAPAEQSSPGIGAAVRAAYEPSLVKPPSGSGPTSGSLEFGSPFKPSESRPVHTAMVQNAPPADAPPAPKEPKPPLDPNQGSMDERIKALFDQARQNPEFIRKMRDGFS